MDQQSPAGRCLTRLVKEIGVETFADLGPDDQVTYAPQPNAFQRKLPNGEAMRVYERENAVHKAAIAETGAAERVEQGGFFSELIHPYTTSFYQYKETSLSVRRQDLSIVVELRLTDGGYSRVFINATQLNAGSVPDALAKQPGQYDASSLEQELGKAAMAMFSGQGDKPQVSVETQALMMDPVANEPLSLLGSRWLLASANALGRNVVALMSDEMYLLSLVALSQGQQKYASMWTMVPQIGKPYEIAIDDRWLTMRPADRAEVRSQRIDRAKWKALIGSLPPGRSAGLDEYAGYAALSDNELMVFVAMLPAMFADQAISIDTLGRRDLLDTMRVYAGLTVTQRKAARTDYVEVPIARLDARTARAARRIVFAEDSLLAQGREQPDWRSPGLVRYPGWEKDKASRLLGAGVPRGSVLRVRVLETDLLYSRPTTGARPGSGMTPEDLGRSKAMNEFYPQSLSVDVGFVCSAKAQQLLLEFEFPGIGYLYRRGQVDLLPREMVYAPVTDLSKEVQARIEAAYKSAAAEYRKAKGGGGE